MPANSILDAIAGGFRLKVAVKGRLAEAGFAAVLADEKARGVIDDFGMIDKDDQPDARIQFRGQPKTAEVKNVHPGIRIRRPAIVVETQKTRTSNNDKASRFYKVDQFNVVAACLFNVNGQWAYLYARTQDLLRHKTYPERLAPIQLIPLPFDPANGVWHTNLEDALL